MENRNAEGEKKKKIKFHGSTWKKSGEDVDTSKYAGLSLEVSWFQMGRPFLPNLGTVLRRREQWNIGWIYYKLMKKIQKGVSSSWQRKSKYFIFEWKKYACLRINFNCVKVCADRIYTCFGNKGERAILGRDCSVVRAYTDLAEDQDLVPSTHIRPFTTIYKSSSREPDLHGHLYTWHISGTLTFKK